MGIVITAKQGEQGTQPPFGIVVVIECDQASEFFCRGFMRFEHPDGYIGSHAEAMKAGWLERQSPQGRLWLCPTCSGKS